MWEVNPEQTQALLDSIQSIKPFEIVAWEYVEAIEGEPGGRRRRWAAKFADEERARVANGHDMRQVLMVLSDEIARMGEPEHSLFVTAWELPEELDAGLELMLWNVRLSRTGTTPEAVCLVYEARRVRK
jgi:hypothetical protein